MAFTRGTAPTGRLRPWRVYDPGRIWRCVWAAGRSPVRSFPWHWRYQTPARLRRLLRDSRLHVERARGGRAAGPGRRDGSGL